MPHDIKARLAELYSENVTAKILRAATALLENNDPPTHYPEWVPQSGNEEGRYQLKPIDFWTCGFFPGSIHSLLERSIKYPGSLKGHSVDPILIRDKLESLGRSWSEPLHPQAQRLNTHDLGFMIQPHMRPRWELYHDVPAFQTIKTAAESLYSRYNPAIGAIRSWDYLTWLEGVDIVDMKENFVVIIDSMCNLDLLYYIAAHTGRSEISDAATVHGKKLIETHLRKDDRKRQGYDGTLYSTCHVVNFGPDGQIKARYSAQGYDVSSTWARGQAWAILGYAQSYVWTRDPAFLDAARGLSEYFMLRMEDAPPCVEIAKPGGNGRETAGRYVPLWDFDAPIQDEMKPIRDTSAAMAAANGMLILSQSLAGLGLHQESARYLEDALRIAEDVISLSLSPERAGIKLDGVELQVTDGPNLKKFDSILMNATIANQRLGYEKFTDHGLVYADYYFIEFGNRLLRFGIC
ncbi:hypothetical protein jhhlp_005348 [Lomentospora prolificans]|uniref:Unsaturated glucuronyl hydrolase n=1 Tax=Lomentospora prolificans TaxID=41688 RepID=A0A2N3N7M7_9PEZI|nr:hypothetical protein jhhlp_005348 [Lomentospora prolificans]